jgi:restriction endonuclease S subunit
MKKSGLDSYNLRDAIVKIWNGKDISEKDYSYLPTQYTYLTITNVYETRLDFEDKLYLIEATGERLEKHRLKTGDIIIARSGATLGVTHLFELNEGAEVFIPSGYLTMLRVDEARINKSFLVNYLNSALMKEFFSAYSCGKDTQNLSQQSIMRIPFPVISKKNQNEILDKVRAKDLEIDKFRQSIPNMQEVIDDVFRTRLGYESLEKTIEKDEVWFMESLSEVGKRRHFRTGVKYNSFSKHRQGLLFETKKGFEIRRLGELIQLYPAKKLKKGILDKEYILIDKEDVEQKTGVIKDEEMVDRIDSDKKVFGNSDILVSKIRPYLGQVFANDKTKPYIGTPEFVPYKVKGDQSLAHFIRYILLSKHFLYFSGRVMSGKLQPRLAPDEMLDLRIPMPPPEDVRAVVEEIGERMGDTKRMMAALNEMIAKRDARFIDLIVGLSA